MLTRRDLVKVAAVAAVAGVTPPELEAGDAGTRLFDVPSFGSVTLLHITDPHGAARPVFYREPDRLTHRFKVALGVERHFAAHGVMHRKARAYAQKRMSIAGLASNVFGADDSAAARAIVNDDDLAELHALGERARHDVERSARGEGHDDAHLFRRKFLCKDERADEKYARISECC